MTTTIRVGKMTLLEPSIVMLDIDEGMELGSEDIFELNSASMQLCDQTSYAILTLMNKPGIISTPEARKTGAEMHLKFPKVADALVVNSLAEKLIANFYIKFNRPSVPTRMFTNEKDALSWLREQLHLYNQNRD